MNKKSWKFYNPTRIIFGTGGLECLKDEVLPYKNYKNILLLCGRNALRQSGYLNMAIKLLEGKRIILVDKVEPNPEISFIDSVIHFVRRKEIKLVVGFGGGSVIDTAKVVSLLADKKQSLKEILKKNIQIKDRNLTCFVIPTTAGTGSEVTKTSSVWERAKGNKLTMNSDAMFPDVAIIDPLLTLSLGPYQTASTGLDALSHAIESFWAKKASVVSQMFSLAAVRLVFSNLKKAYKKPKDIKAREGMSLASLYAGLAISNTGTTAGHAISYYMTARFGITHGLACALSLPFLIKFNGRFSELSLKPLVQAAGFTQVNQFSDGIKQLITALGLSVSLKDYGVRRQDLSHMLSKSFSASNINNSCVRLKRSDLTTILEKML